MQNQHDAYYLLKDLQESGNLPPVLPALVELRLYIDIVKRELLGIDD